MPTSAEFDERYRHQVIKNVEEFLEEIEKYLEQPARLELDSGLQ